MRVKIDQVDVVDGMLRVDVTMPLAALRNGGEGAEPHTVIVPEAALENRMAVYGLARRDEALAAILREHATRLNGLPESRETDSVQANRAGGMRRDVAVLLNAARVSPAAMAMLGLV